MESPHDGEVSRNGPLSIEEAKKGFMDEFGGAPGSPPSVRSWVAGHPTHALIAAAGIGLLFVFFPRVRKIAVPLAIAVAKRALL